MSTNLILNGRKLSSIWFLKLYLINEIKLKIEFMCSVALIYSYSSLEILYVFFTMKYLMNNLPSRHKCPGSVGKDIESTPPSFNLLIISNRNFSGLLICSRQCEIIILSKKLSSNGKLLPSYK